ncbi:MAG TPA: acyl-CoA thioesterase II, partial [Caulobacter sp.]|nr:acyl-CoA thioesterase II [Caulobacter sp.]
PRIFGGLVIAQALLAAYETVEDRVCHSLHAYFIRPGDVTIPVLYEVDRSRDGGSFTTRRVIAIQNGKQIFNLAASFQVAEEGLEHQSPMPGHPDPESVKTELDQLLAKFGDKLPEKMREQMNRPRPIDLRWPDPQNMFKPVPKPPRKQVWMRAKAPIGPEVKLQQACLAYASDMAFMETALRVHGLTWQTPGLQSASLDHAMWFHRPVDFNDWLLFDQDCPSTSQGRGFIRGEMYTRDGVLAASVAQECLMRVKT